MNALARRGDDSVAPVTLRLVPLIRFGGRPTVVWPGEQPRVLPRGPSENSQAPLTKALARVPMAAMPTRSVRRVDKDVPTALAKIVPHRLSIEQALVSWQKDLETRLGRSHHGVTRGPQRVRRLLSEAAITSLDGITNQAIVAHLQNLVEVGGPSSRKTVANRLSELRSFMKYVYLMEDREGSPLANVTLPAARSRKGWHPFTAEELCAVIAAAESREAKAWQTRNNGPLASTFYRFLAFTGLRREEAQTQRWDDVSFENCSLTVTQDKSRRNDEIPISAECVELLRAWKRWAPGELVFPRCPAHHSLQGDMEAAGIASGVDGKRGQWHRFRKAAITLRANAGAELRELHKFARHTDVAMTANVYDNPQLAQLRDTAGLMDKILAKVSNDLTNRGPMPDIHASRPTNLPTPSSLEKHNSPLSVGAPSGVGLVAIPGSHQGGAPSEDGGISGMEPSNGSSRPGVTGKVEPGGIDPTALHGPLGETLRLLLSSHDRLLEIVGRLLG